MPEDKAKLNMKVLKFVSLASIGFGLWLLAAQLIHDKDSIDMTSILPFLFVGWIGDHAHKAMTAMANRMTDLEIRSAESAKG
jgi:hypothetical protein